MPTGLHQKLGIQRTERFRGIFILLQFTILPSVCASYYIITYITIREDDKKEENRGELLFFPIETC